MTYCLQRPLALMLTLLIMACGTALAESQPIVAQYDRENDTVTIAEGSGSLTQLLRQISAQSGVEIKIDPNEERQVYGGITNKPVADALVGLAKQYQLNYVMGHMRDEEGKNELVSFAILKEGEMSAAGLPPLVDLGTEAMSQMRNAERHKEHSAMKAYRRWESRFSQLPVEVRSRIQANAQKNLERAAEREAKAAERRAAAEARRAEKLAIREAAQQRLKETNPELYAKRQATREKLEAQALEEAERRRAANEALRNQ